MSRIVLFAYAITLNISTRNTVTKIQSKKLCCVIFAMQSGKSWANFRVIGTLKTNVRVRVVSDIYNSRLRLEFAYPNTTRPLMLQVVLICHAGDRLYER